MTFLILSVDMVDMNSVITNALQQHGLTENNDHLMDVGDMITVLLTMFENIGDNRREFVNIPQSVDMTLNWLLNVYDR